MEEISQPDYTDINQIYDGSCPICLINDASEKTECSHHFCAKCLSCLIKCALCQRKFSRNFIIRYHGNDNDYQEINNNDEHNIIHNAHHNDEHNIIHNNKQNIDHNINHIINHYMDHNNINYNNNHDIMLNLVHTELINASQLMNNYKHHPLYVRITDLINNMSQDNNVNIKNWNNEMHNLMNICMDNDIYYVIKKLSHVLKILSFTQSVKILSC